MSEIRIVVQRNYGHGWYGVTEIYIHFANKYMLRISEDRYKLNGCVSSIRLYNDKYYAAYSLLWFKHSWEILKDIRDHIKTIILSYYNMGPVETTDPARRGRHPVHTYTPDRTAILALLDRMIEEGYDIPQDEALR